MKLSDRLQMIADEINIGETMADIGTDHGFLPLYLLETKKCKKAIMADISQGSLQKARENCQLYFPEKVFDLRQGSGIEVLKDGEVDTVVIAGMGGILMTEILGNDTEKSHSIKKYILQPRNNIGKLREWLSKNSFTIIKEQLVRESKFIWEVLTVVNENPIHYELPRSLLTCKGPLLKEFLYNKLNMEVYIEENIGKAKDPDLEKLKECQYRIHYIKEMIGDLYG